jgi:hypothetical protein
MNRTGRTGAMRKHARSGRIRYSGGEQTRGMRETRAEACGVLLEWLCVAGGGYPGPRRIGRLILLKNRKNLINIRARARRGSLRCYAQGRDGARWNMRSPQQCARGWRPLRAYL